MALSIEETDHIFKLYLNFDKRVREILAKKKMTPSQLADGMGVQRSVIYRFISCGGHPDMFNLMKMADAFGISIDELVGLKELK